jgi:hypothetical protein
MANEFIARNGIVALNNSTITGSLDVAGNLTTTGTITAQKLVVQQVTSSVVFSSGSNVFGNSISNTQSMTGSVGITGSLSINGVSTIGSVIGTTNYVPKFTGTNVIENSQLFDNGTNVGIGTASPTGARTVIRTAGVDGANEIALQLNQGDGGLAVNQEVQLGFGQGNGTTSLAQIGQHIYWWRI